MSFHFCPECGARYADESRPRICGSCGHVHYFNPLPVAVLLVQNQPRSGLLVIEHNEADGTWLSLPSGFVHEGETWQEACSRKLKEETRYVAAPATVAHFETVGDPDGRTILIFGHSTVTGLAADSMPDSKVQPRRFVPWNEARTFATRFRYPLHTAAVARYLLMRKQARRRTDR